MRTVRSWSCAALALVVLASQSWSQQPENLGQPKPAKPAAADGAQKPGAKPAMSEDTGPAIHRMEITNGPIRTVHYINQNMSPSDRAALRDMERSENELALADHAFMLKAQYLSNESMLQGRRTAVQNLLYGYNSARQSSGLTGVAGVLGGYLNNGLGAYPYSGGTLGYGYNGGLYQNVVSGSQESSNSLAYGVGDEGVIKTEMARALAGTITPEYQTTVARNFDRSVARVASSDSLRTALRMGGKKESGTAFAGFEMASSGANVEVTRKMDGKSDKISGTVLREDEDWIVLQTPEGKRSLRKSEVIDILEKKK